MAKEKTLKNRLARIAAYAAMTSMRRSRYAVYHVDTLIMHAAFGSGWGSTRYVPSAELKFQFDFYSFILIIWVSLAILYTKYKLIHKSTILFFGLFCFSL